MSANIKILDEQENNGVNRALTRAFANKIGMIPEKKITDPRNIHKSPYDFDESTMPVKLDDFMASNWNFVVLPQNTIMFKGVETVSKCKDVHSPFSVYDMYQTTNSWMSDIETASLYSPNKIFTYITNRPLVLFDITDFKSVNRMFSILLKKRATLVDQAKSSSVFHRKDKSLKKVEVDIRHFMIATGIGCNINEQLEHLEKEHGKETREQFKRDGIVRSGEFDDKNRLCRLSVLESDVAVSMVLRDYLPNLDGYIGKEVSTAYHGGTFSKEVCIFGTKDKVSLSQNIINVCKDINVGAGDKNGYVRPVVWGGRSPDTKEKIPMSVLNLLDEDILRAATAKRTKARGTGVSMGYNEFSTDVVCLEDTKFYKAVQRYHQSYLCGE